MAEMMAFNRRHTPRHGDVNVENRRHSLTSAGHAAGDLPAHSNGDHASNTSVVMQSAPKSNSKKRRDKAVATVKASSSSGATGGGASGDRKMSGSQLRMFFMLCVALYFSVIFFADDIVRFAKWMSDEDPVGAWQPPSKPPMAGGTTPKPAQPPSSVDMKKNAAELVVVKGATQTEKNEEKKDEKTGNLRGGEEGKKTVEETKAPESTQVETPGPQQTQKQEEEKEEEGTVDAERAAETKVVEQVQTEEPREEPHEELPEPTPVAKATLSTEEDAPLESVENDDRKVRGETTTEPATETPAVPAQIPQLGLVSNPITDSPKKEEGARMDDAATATSTQQPVTPQLIQAT